MLSIVSRVMQQVHSLLIDPMTSQRLERIRSLIESAGSTYVSVQFTKKDGSHRQLTFNPADHNDIKGTGDVSKVDENILEFVTTPSNNGDHSMHVV